MRFLTAQGDHSELFLVTAVQRVIMAYRIKSVGLCLWESGPLALDVDQEPLMYGLLFTNVINSLSKEATQYSLVYQYVVKEGRGYHDFVVEDLLLGIKM